MIPRADILVGGRTDIGLERSVNQDHLGYYEPEDDETFARLGRLIVVCDGMGGHAGGEVASQLGVKTIIEHYQRSSGDDPMAALKSSIEEANRAIWDHAARDSALRGMGTTAVGFVLKAGKCYVGHVGDSRLYRIRDGQLDAITLYDHSLVQQLVNDGVIKEDEMEEHEEKNVILRSLGVKPNVDVDIQEFDYQVDDIYISSSDGLTGLVTKEECLTVSQHYKEFPAHGASYLVDLANHYGGYDNITAQMVVIRAMSVEEANEKGLEPQELVIAMGQPEATPDAGADDDAEASAEAPEEAPSAAPAAGPAGLAATGALPSSDLTSALEQAWAQVNEALAGARRALSMAHEAASSAQHAIDATSSASAWIESAWGVLSADAEAKAAAAAQAAAEAHAAAAAQAAAEAHAAAAAQADAEAQAAQSAAAMEPTADTADTVTTPVPPLRDSELDTPTVPLEASEAPTGPETPPAECDIETEDATEAGRAAAVALEAATTDALDAAAAAPEAEAPEPAAEAVAEELAVPASEAATDPLIEAAVPGIAADPSPAAEAAPAVEVADAAEAAAEATADAEPEAAAAAEETKSAT